jgi:hypothetical protein
MAAKAKDERKEEFDRIMADYPESHMIDGLPELHQRVVLKIMGRPVDVTALLAGAIACLIFPVVLVQFAPIYVALPAGIFFALRFGASRNKEGDGIYSKMPKLRKKWSLLVPDRVRCGVVAPHQGRLIAVCEGTEMSWAELERRINERTR